MIRQFSLTICTALVLATVAAAQLSAAELLTRKGSVPQVGGNDTAKSADVINPGAALMAVAPQSPKAMPEGAEALINCLAGIKHGRHGNDTSIEVPAQLQMMLKARGKIDPPKPAKGKLVQITNTKVSPYASMGMIMSGCSGALVMKRYVLTAPWCVYDMKAQKFYDKLDFLPALNGNDAPVGTIKWKNVWIPKGFQEKGDLAYAFALIELESDIGDQVGWFGFGPSQGSEAVKQLTLAGYPFTGVPQNTLWEVKCTIDANEQNAYFYRCPGDGKTLASMLGSPFIAKGAKEGDAAQLLGIHITAQDDKQNSWWAMKLTDAHTQTILSWANGGEVPPVEPEVTDTGTTGTTPACTCDDKAADAGDDD